MAYYQGIPTSLNGNALSGAGLTCYWEHGDPAPRSSPVQYQTIEASIIGKGVQDIRAQPTAVTWVMTIEAASTDETAIAEMNRIFNPEAGQVIYRETDGDGTVWRTRVRCIGTPQRIFPNVFKVPLRAAHGLFESDAASTDISLAVSGDSVVLDLPNAGNRNAYPTFTSIPQLTKTNPLENYTFSMRGFIVNRAKREIVNKGAYLFDVSGGISRLNTASSSAGATVAQTTGATTTAEVLDSGETSIDVTSAAGFSSTGGIAIIDNANSTREQISYTGKSGNTLTGCTRGIGGTAAQAHSSGVTIAPSGILRNGDDCRVYVDDVEVDRWLILWATSTSDVLINISLPKRVKLTLADDISSISDEMSFIEDTRGLEAKGFIVIEDEMIYYAAKTAHGISGCTRGAWGTTAATHTTADPVYGNPKRFVVCAGRANAGSPPSPDSKRPCFEHALSSNTIRRYGNASFDTSTVFFDRDNPDRTEQWRPGFDTDGNDVAPLTQISASDDILTFKDDAPGDGGAPYNFAELDIPFGIEVVSAGITADWTPSAEILNLEMFGRDNGGVLKLLDELQQSAAAAVRTKTPTATLYGLKLKGRYNCSTGVHDDTGADAGATITNATNNTNVDGLRAQQFIIDRQAYISHVVARLALATPGSEPMAVSVHRDSSDSPEDGDDGLLGSFTGGVTVDSTSSALYKFTRASGPIILEAGTYWLIMRRTTTFADNVIWYRQAPHGMPRRLRGGVKAGGVWNVTTQPHDFKLCAVYNVNGEVSVQDDQPLLVPGSGARIGGIASFDNLILELNDAVSDPETLYVHRTGAFTNGLYHYNRTISNAETGDELGVDLWCAVGASLEINCANRTAILTESGIAYPVPRAISPSNISEWMPLGAGANTVTITDPDMRDNDEVAEWRSVKA